MGSWDLGLVLCAFFLTKLFVGEDNTNQQFISQVSHLSIQCLWFIGLSLLSQEGDIHGQKGQLATDLTPLECIKICSCSGRMSFVPSVQPSPSLLRSSSSYVALEGVQVPVQAHSQEESDPTHHDAQHHHLKRRRCRHIAGALLVFLVVGMVVAVLLVTLNQQQTSRRQIHQLQTFIDHRFHALRSEMHESVIASASSASLIAPPQDKYAVPSVPSRKYQFTRGTCWDFGTMGPVEHQYRLQGVQNGWLRPDEFVRLSEQAYGKQIIELCQQPEYHHRCLLPGDRVAFNSTEGGEATLLFAFADVLANAIVPDSVCPYIHEGDNSSCPHLDAALKANPIRFQLESFSTLYDVNSIKRALLHKQYSMPITIPVRFVPYLAQI